MVNAPNTNHLLLPAGKYGKSAISAIQQCHPVNDGKYCLQTETVKAIGALTSLKSKQNLAVEERRETHRLWSDGNDKRIKDYTNRETAVAETQVEAADTVIRHE